MKSLLDFDEIVAVLSPEVLGEPPSRFSSISVDSRKIASGALFVALRGENTDGHRYVRDAFESGAAGSLVSREGWKGLAPEAQRVPPDGTVIMVDDGEEALTELGRRAIEKQEGMTRIGITGSNGKTTTKELVGGVLKLSGKTFLTPGNYNSTIGIPLSVAPLSERFEYGVFEMAMNKRGEMARLAAMVQPEWALITNIGTAHIGLLGSQAAIAEEKAQIAGHFTGAETCFLPKGDGYADFLAERVAGRVVFYGEGATPDLESVDLEGLGGSILRWRGRKIRLRLPGRHNVHNALGAISLATELGIEVGVIADGLESVRPLFGRGELIEGPVTLFQDCYNANPESVSAALDLVSEAGWPGRVVVVLGPMKELGESAAAGHAGVVQAALSFDPEGLFLFGEEYVDAIADISKNGTKSERFWTDSFGELLQSVQSFVRTGDLVVIKGSRAAALERIGEALRKGEA